MSESLKRHMLWATTAVLITGIVVGGICAGTVLGPPATKAEAANNCVLHTLDARGCLESLGNAYPESSP